MKYIKSMNFDNIEENLGIGEEVHSFGSLRIGESTGFEEFELLSSRSEQGNQSLFSNCPFNSNIINFENMNFSLPFTDFINRPLNNHLEEFQFDSINNFQLNLDSSNVEYNSNSNENYFIGQKRNLFKITYPKKFEIFKKGGENKIIRGLIDEHLHNKISPKNVKFSRKIRKFNADNIRKKIKSRFLKTLKIAINQKLKNANSIKFFNLLPQKFICNVSKNINKDVLFKTFKEIYSKDFCEIQKQNIVDYNKYCQNIEVLKYLERRNDIAKKSNYDNIKDMKYYQIFDEYLRSEEFENEIANLKKEKEKEEYINDYIKLACNFINFFLQ